MRSGQKPEQLVTKHARSRQVGSETALPVVRCSLDATEVLQPSVRFPAAPEGLPGPDDSKQPDRADSATVMPLLRVPHQCVPEHFGHESIFCDRPIAQPHQRHLRSPCVDTHLSVTEAGFAHGLNDVRTCLLLKIGYVGGSSRVPRPSPYMRHCVRMTKSLCEIELRPQAKAQEPALQPREALADSASSHVLHRSVTAWIMMFGIRRARG